MAAHGLCQRLVRGLVSTGSLDGQPASEEAIDRDRFEITVFGEEPRLAYDRVNLSKVFDGRTEEDLLLADQAWYDDQCIQFKKGCRIERIDTERREVIDQSGCRYGYDRLVLATGSRAFVPPIPGRNSDGVFVYRTLEDLEKISAHVTKGAAKVGAVIGGGLLGLEAAKVLQGLGLRTSVIEMAPRVNASPIGSKRSGKTKRTR